MVYTFKSNTGSVSSTQLQSSVESACPGQNVTFTCTIPSPTHEWRVPSLSISRTLTRYDRMPSDDRFQFAVSISDMFIKSTATVAATEDLNGTLVSCRDGNQPPVGTQNSTVKLIGKQKLQGLHDGVVINDCSHKTTSTLLWHVYLL